MRQTSFVNLYKTENECCDSSDGPCWSAWGMDTAVGQVSKDKKNQHIARALQFNIIKGGEGGGWDTRTKESQNNSVFTIHF